MTASIRALERLTARFATSDVVRETRVLGVALAGTRSVDPRSQNDEDLRRKLLALAAL